MKNIKKFSFILAFALIITCFVPMLSGCFSGSKYKEFKINYTANLEFLIGEEYHDDLLKGYATTKEDEEVDVTDQMTVDSSAYNKDEVGTYKIYCEFEKTKLSYEVKVVDEITDLTEIANRLVPVSVNTFNRDENGVFSYESSNSSSLMGSDFDEKLIYIDDDGQISAYLTWEIDDVVAAEYWYVGTESAGTLTIRYSDDETQTVESEQTTLEGCCMGLAFAAALYELPVTVFPMPYLEDGFEFDPISVSLVRGIDSRYELTIIELDEDDEEVVTVLEYNNDMLVAKDGVEFTFPKTATATIPTVPEATTQE